ncbi:hypothetical protein B0T11DRAFT_326195 [Plectosphaerella cucumerina]|uniref:Uncharacterized protein n=1 Tax=Plectosphaerella cucumerina TaxID=40658 RepID=A0A8K0TJL8_9PEZI|nr:hypothetical protein B0T11DRAFT_326195 [Plectosphaerella cucumerina]
MASENSATDGQRQLRRSARVAAMPKPEVKPEAKPKPKAKPKSKSKSKSVPKSDNPDNDTASGAQPAGIHDSTKSDAAAAPIRRPVRDPDQVIPDSQESLFSASVQQPVRDPHQVIQDSQDRSSSEGIIHGQEILAGIEPTQPVAQEALSQVTVDLHQMPLGHIVAIQSEPEQDLTQAVHDTDMADVESTKPTSLSPSPTGPVVHVADEPVEAIEDVQNPPPIWDESTDASDGMQVNVPGDARMDRDGDAAMSDDASEGSAQREDLSEGHDDPDYVDELTFDEGRWPGYESSHEDQSGQIEDELAHDDYDLDGYFPNDVDEDDDEASDYADEDASDDLEDLVPRFDEESVNEAYERFSRRIPRRQRVLDVPDEEGMRRLGMLPPTGPRFDVDAVRRFESIFFGFFHELTLECELIGNSPHSFEYMQADVLELPVAFSVISWINVSVRERGERAVAEDLLQDVPNIVRSVLGRRHLTPWDLLDLPVLVPELQLVGTYVDIPLSQGMTDPASYVGSGTESNRGIVRRIRTHMRASRMSVPSGKDTSAHGMYLMKDGVSCNVRVLSLAAIKQSAKPKQGMLEGIFVAILNTFVKDVRETPTTGNLWSTKVAYDWVVQLRKKASAACGERFPDLASLSHGLNVMSPLRQGIRGSQMYGSGLPVPAVIERCADCGKDVPDIFQGNWQNISGQHIAKADRWTTAVTPGDVVGVICGKCWRDRIINSRLDDIERWRQHPDRTESELEADEYCHRCKMPRRINLDYTGRGKSLLCGTCGRVLRLARQLKRDPDEYFKRHRWINSGPTSAGPTKRSWSDRTEATASQKQADDYCCRCGKRRVKGHDSTWTNRGKRSTCHYCRKLVTMYATRKKVHWSQVLRKIWEDQKGVMFWGTEHGQEPDDFITQALRRTGPLPRRQLTRWNMLPKRSKSEEDAHEKCWSCGYPRDNMFTYQGRYSTCNRCIHRLDSMRKAEGSAASRMDVIKKYQAEGKTIPPPPTGHRAPRKRAPRTKSWEEADGTCWSCGAQRPIKATFGNFPLSGKDSLCRRCYDRAKKQKEAEDEEYLRVHGSPRRPSVTMKLWTRVIREAGRQDFRRRAGDPETPKKQAKAGVRSASEEAAHARCLQCGVLRKDRSLRNAGKNSMCQPCYRRMKIDRVDPKLAKIPQGLSKADRLAATNEIFDSARNEIRAEVAARAQEKLDEGQQDTACGTESSPVPTPADMAPPALVIPATTARTGQSGRPAWSPMNDFEPVRTSATGLLCAIHAIRRSITFQMPGVELPTVEDLQSLFARLQTQQATSANMAAYAPYADLLTNQDNLGLDQITWIFRTWARENGHNVRLGVVYPWQGSHLHYTPPLEEDDEAGEEASAIWIYSNDEGDVDGGMGHWSGMKPRN